MNRRLRLLLPLVQVAIAVILTVHNRLRPRYWESGASSAWDWQWCAALNAPATAVWACLLRFRGYWYQDHLLAGIVLENVVYFVLVGALWYAVSIEISGKGRSVLSANLMIRTVADLIGMIFGGVLAWGGSEVFRYRFGYVSAYTMSVVVPYFLWAAVIVAFYGHDLWRYFAGAKQDLRSQSHLR